MISVSGKELANINKLSWSLSLNCQCFVDDSLEGCESAKELKLCRLLSRERSRKRVRERCRERPHAYLTHFMNLGAIS